MKIYNIPFRHILPNVIRTYMSEKMENVFIANNLYVRTKSIDIFTILQ